MLVDFCPLVLPPCVWGWGMSMPGIDADVLPGDWEPGDGGVPDDGLLLDDGLLDDGLLLDEELLDGDEGVLAEGCWLWFCCMVLQPDRASSADIARIGAYRLNISPIAASINSPGPIFANKC